MAWRCGGQVLAWPAEGKEAGVSIHANVIEGGKSPENKSVSLFLL